MNPSGTHRFVFVRSSSLAAADDCAGVAHAASRRRGLAGNEADNRLSYVLLDVFRGDFFRIAADFADQDDRVCVRIFVEHAHSIQKTSADDGIAADSDAGGLANTELSK